MSRRAVSPNVTTCSALFVADSDFGRAAHDPRIVERIGAVGAAHVDDAIDRIAAMGERSLDEAPATR